MTRHHGLWLTAATGPESSSSYRSDVAVKNAFLVAVAVCVDAIMHAGEKNYRRRHPRATEWGGERGGEAAVLCLWLVLRQHAQTQSHTMPGELYTTSERCTQTQRKRGCRLHKRAQSPRLTQAVRTSKGGA